MKKKEFKDPTLKIQNYHDPALSNIIRKHDRLHMFNESTKILCLKSQQRLKTVQGNKTKFIHNRFNMETLRTSPLMCFPHFEEMTKFLYRWFEIKDQLKAQALTQTRQSIYAAQEKFASDLFLLLQETSKASPLSPKPLIGIYNWYLQRDLITKQNRPIDNKKTDDSQYCEIMLNDGKKIKIEKSLMNPSQQLVEEIFDPSSIKLKFQNIKSDKKNDQAEENIVKVLNKPQVIAETFSPKQIKKSPQVHQNKSKFDFEKFHKLLEDERRGEKDVDSMAKKIRENRKFESFVM